MVSIDLIAQAKGSVRWRLFMVVASDRRDTTRLVGEARIEVSTASAKFAVVFAVVETGLWVLLLQA